MTHDHQLQLVQDLAEAALMAADYGSSVPQLLHKHGYGQGRPVIAEAVHNGAWVKCDLCWYSGTATAVRHHKAMYHSPQGSAGSPTPS